jgi:hypothetical protein
MKRLIIAGLPRSGTTLIATLLGAQPSIHFLTEYFPAFTEASMRLQKGWNAPLSPGERRIALALVRDQFLRVRHPVLVKLDGFATLDELHVRVCEELGANDAWVGHKLLLGPDLLRATLEQTDLHCLLLFRDPRDAALSFFHRTGAGVEEYVRNWAAMARLWRKLREHPRLLALRFEDLLTDPERTAKTLGDWLGRELDLQVSALRFQRSRASGATNWSENSAFQDVQRRFDRQPLGRWKSQPQSAVVRYAAWAARAAMPLLGYDPTQTQLLPAERLQFQCLQALDSGERRAYSALNTSFRWLRQRLGRPGWRWSE